METFGTVVVVMAMIALGVLLIHLANRQTSDRVATPTTAAPGRPPGSAAPGRERGEPS
ncbi:hypothetical protein [Streptomyces sp. NPDC060002]|uniref:hypothetical protein n=1 Tax=Streptomyces sp. NPDC060002 TaxID=3347033 RepID=UPI0036BB6F16